MYKYKPECKNIVLDALYHIPTYSSNSANDHTSVIACLVYKSCINKVSVLLEYIKGDYNLLF